MNKKPPACCGWGNAERLAILNEFVAACLDFGQQQLRTEGRVTATVHLAYGMYFREGEPDIRQYELKALGCINEEQELDRVRRYARKTSAQAVCIVTDLGNDPEAAGLFPDYDGALIVAAVSPDGEIGIMRPYRKSGGRIRLGDPRITDGLGIHLLEGIF